MRQKIVEASLKMLSSIRRRIIGFFTLAIMSISVTACGADPYQLGINQFHSQVFAYGYQRPKADWTVFVEHGIVATGWLWFKHQNPVVYAEVENTGTSNTTDTVVQFGKTIKTLGESSPGIGLIFYVDSSQIPQHVDISWKANGKTHHETINFNSMIELNSLP